MPVRYESEPNQRLFYFSKELYTHCSVLVGSRNEIEHDLNKDNYFFHNKTNLNEYELIYI